MVQSKKVYGKFITVGDYVQDVGLILEVNFDLSKRMGFDVFKGQPYVKILSEQSCPYGAAYKIFDIELEYTVITDKKYLRVIFSNIYDTLHKSLSFILEDIKSLDQIRNTQNIFDVN